MGRTSHVGRKSNSRLCKKCGRKLSEYNTTGKCHSHAVPPDSTGDWDPLFFQGLRRDENIKVGSGMELTMILGRAGGICSPGQNPIRKDAR